jgi:hypothetical protein
MKLLSFYVIVLASIFLCFKLESITHAYKVSRLTGAPFMQVLHRDLPSMHSADANDVEVGEE